MRWDYVLGTIALIGYYAHLVLSFRPDWRALIVDALRRINARPARQQRLHATGWKRDESAG